ncbi:unnamed protein product [Caenorhabditis brenneri]
MELAALSAVITLFDALLKTGQFKFLEITNHLENIITVGSLIKSYPARRRNNEESEETEQIEILAKKVEELRNKSIKKFGNSAYTARKAEIKKIAQNSAILLWYLVETLKQPELANANDFGERRNEFMPDCTDSFIALLTHENTNPMLLEMRKNPMVSKATHKKWTEFFDGILSQFLFIEAFYCGLCSNQIEYNGLYSNGQRDYVISLTKKIDELNQDMDQQIENFKQIGLDFSNVIDLVHEIQDNNEDKGKEAKAKLLKEELEKILTDDAFLIIVYDHFEERHRHAFKYNHRQTRTSLNRGSCRANQSNAIVYRSRRWNTATESDKLRLKSEVKAAGQTRIPFSNNYEEYLGHMKGNFIHSVELLAMIRTDRDLAVELVNCTEVPGVRTVVSTFIGFGDTKKSAKVFHWYCIANVDSFISSALLYSCDLSGRNNAQCDTRANELEYDCVFNAWNFGEHNDSSGFGVGVFHWLGVSNQFQVVSGAVSAMLVPPSYIYVFETRSHLLTMNRFRLNETWKRVVYHLSVLAVYNSVFILYFQIPKNQYAAKLEALEFDPCPTREYFMNDVFVFTDDPNLIRFAIWCYAPVLVMFFTFHTLFHVICTVYHLFVEPTQSLALQTRRNQQKFFTGIVLQTIIPQAIFSFILFMFCLDGAIHNVTQQLMNSCVFVVAIHGILESITILLVHRAYRHAVWKLLSGRNSMLLFFLQVPKDQYEAKLKALEFDRCPTREYFTNDVLVLFDDPVRIRLTLWFYAPVLATFIIAHVSFQVICTVYYLFFEPAQLSAQETRKNQQKFFIGLILQTSVPVSMLFYLLFVVVLDGITNSVTQELTHSCVIVIAMHGVLASVTTISEHRAYRHAVWKLLWGRTRKR